jgi:hypothetical protein
VGPDTQPPETGVTLIKRAFALAIAGTNASAKIARNNL